jgi:hypothetical protein
MMNNNLGYKYCFPSEISFHIASSLVESSSFNIAATRLSYINAASKRRPKFSSGVLKERCHSLKQFTCSANQETKRKTHTHKTIKTLVEESNKYYKDFVNIADVITTQILHKKCGKSN